MKTPARPLRPATTLVVVGRDPAGQHGFVNPPVYHASTVLYPSAEAMAAHRARYTYGRRGTPTSEALCDAVTALEGGAGTVLTPSGLAAVSMALTSVLGAGDHLLMVDSVYGPTRAFCSSELSRRGVEVTYYDPRVGTGIADLLRPNTKAIFLESPGSQTFEVQDVPAITRVARERGIATVMDNTWATPLFFAAHAHGVDISVQAGTKYLSGHSDVMLGTISATEAYWPRVKEAYHHFGMWVGPDDMYLALRGLRTMGVRLAHQEKAAIAVAQWLEDRPEVARVLHPALPSHPDHALFKRDFCGSSGLFSIELRPGPQEAVYAMLDGLALFGMGYSWGGFESLVILFDARPMRTATRWSPAGPTLRLHIGLEAVEDLIADLEAGLQRYAAHC